LLCKFNFVALLDVLVRKILSTQHGPPPGISKTSINVLEFSWLLPEEILWLQVTNYTQKNFQQENTCPRLRTIFVTGKMDFSFNILLNGLT